MTSPIPTPTDVEISAGRIRLPGALAIPENASGLVMFAHGSGSSRRSPRNEQVASVLQRGGLGTLLFDLLSESEADDRACVFDIELLAQRLLMASHWAMSHPAASLLPVGLFGASTGAGAALVAAAREPLIRAVVSRGGRPDLAGDALREVRAPTLLIIGGEDHGVIELNRAALRSLRCEAQMVIVPGATHLFEEPGTLAQVADLARDWFCAHLRRDAA